MSGPSITPAVQQPALCDLLADAAMHIDSATSVGTTPLPESLKTRAKDLVRDLYGLARDVAPEHWAQTMGRIDA